MIHAAVAGLGVVLAPPCLFAAELSSGQLRQPFATLCDVGSYWICWLRHRPKTEAMEVFHAWCADQAAG